MKIGIASDHAGYNLKNELKIFLKGYEIVDFGTNSEESCDYPEYAHLLANAIQDKSVEMGISICGSGNGIQMAVNKHKNVRASLCWKTEISELARLHNDANVCALPARYLTTDEAKEIITTFLNTKFEGGRHQKRVDMINC